MCYCWILTSDFDLVLLFAVAIPLLDASNEIILKYRQFYAELQTVEPRHLIVSNKIKV